MNEQVKRFDFFAHLNDGFAELGYHESDEGSYVRYEDHERIVAALSAQQSAPERGDGWIPVSERLPDIAQEVIVNSEFDGVTAAFLDSYGEWYSPNSDYKFTRVVAWQPLPAAPSLLASHAEGGKV